DGRAGSATIHQDADIYRVRLTAGQSLTHEIPAGRGVWFQLIKGDVACHGNTLSAGDAFSTEDTGTLTVASGTGAEALLFDLR
ncbi:MAG: pirin family protein, partial [Roseimicrobium sp.]